MSKQTNDVIVYLKRDKYVNLNALGFLRNFAEADVYLYDGDVENGVILGGPEQDFFYLNTCDHGFLGEFWEMLPPGHKCFTGVSAPITDVFRKGRQFLWENPCKVYTLTGPFEIADAAGYTVERLVLPDAEEVNEYYTYKSEDSLERIRGCITEGDSTCIRIDGKLACWCAVHLEDNAMGPLFTKEEYRGRGLAAIVTTRLMQILIAKQIIPFVQIIADNSVSEHVANKISGMEHTHDCSWFGIVK